MNPSLHHRITEFMTPFMNDRKEREALVRQALHGCKVLNQIDWEGSASTFTAHLVSKLGTFGSCSYEETSIQTLLLYLGSNKGVDVNRRALQLIQELASISTDPVQASKTSDLLEYENIKQRKHDLNLLMQLWKKINSRNIIRLDDDTQYRKLEDEFYSKNFSNYLYERHNYPELSFISPILEAQLQLYDDALREFNYQLFQSAGIEDFHGRLTIRPDYKQRGLERDVQVHKEREWDKTIDKLLELRQVHEKLVVFIKKAFPEFDFFSDDKASNEYNQ